MPNHVQCRVTAPERVLDSLASDGSIVDFSAVIPMPSVMESNAPRHVEDWARIAVGDINLNEFFGARHVSPGDSFRAGDYGAAADALKQVNVARLLKEGPFPKDFSDADFDALIQQMRALREFGHANWHDWSTANWGTKWNAYDVVDVADDVVTFQTAWSAPIPVITRLSEIHPSESVRLEWADEDKGNNVGDVTFKAGAVVSGGRLTDGSRSAHALYRNLHR